MPTVHTVRVKSTQVVPAALAIGWQAREMLINDKDYFYLGKTIRCELEGLIMALTKADLAEHLFQVMGLNKRQAKEFVEIFFEEIRLALEHGQNVKLSSFGNFILRDKAERPGRNPKTGEIIEVSARRVVTFRPGQKLKERVEKPEA